jgi:S1-C subfamily serine protease
MYFTGTRGIISNKTDQDGPDLLQIDATVDHGNSGGPVIDLHTGRVVGIATSGVMRDKSDRLNFATPMKDVCQILALLRQRVDPSAPRLELALLHNEEGAYTMNVGRSLSRDRWPLEPDDHILAVDSQEVTTLTDFMSALRGRHARTPLTIERAGQRMRVAVAPEFAERTTEQRGLIVDGALIAKFAYDDEASVEGPGGLIVHSTEPGSAAQMLGLQGGDVLYRLDGRSFTDLDSLTTYVHARAGKGPMKAVFRRFSPAARLIFDYIARELPNEDVRTVSPDSSPVAAKVE